MTFKDLPIGQTFKFEPGVSSFHAVCTKISARRYTWRGRDGWPSFATVGTIKVGVKPA